MRGGASTINAGITIVGGQGPQSRPISGLFGLAFSSSTMRLGTSHGQDSLEAAKKGALANCQTVASDCKFEAYVENRCMAAAISRSDGDWSTGDDPNRYRAQILALENCRKNGGQNCVLQAAAYASDDPRFPSPKPELIPGPNDDPIVGCYQYGGGFWVIIRPDHTVVGGPFTASWQLLNAAQRTYQLTWQQPAISKVTISADQLSLSGGNQYGGHDTATRIAGSSGLVGTWNWFDLSASKVTVNSDGTYSIVASNGTWRGKWQLVKAFPGTYILTASDTPKDRLRLAADGSRVSGANQYGIVISGLRMDSCPGNQFAT